MLIQVNLTVDVYCTDGDGGPAYRIYVDNDLLTERTWTWPAYEVFVRENIVVDVEPGAHRLEVKECHGNSVIYIKNITVNGEPNNGLFFV